VVRIAFLFAILAAFAIAAEPEPKFKPSKETTFVLGPLDANGFIDYEAAVNKLLKGNTTPETNAVVLLLKCFGPKPEGAELKPDFYKALGVEAPSVEGEYLVSHSKHFKTELSGEGMPAFNEFEACLKQQPWKPADSPKHAEWLKINEKPLAIAVEASRRKDYFHPMISRSKDGKKGLLIGALLPTVQKTRELANALSLRAMLKLGQGQVADAFDDAIAMHRLARLVGRGGSLIELLVGIAIDAIAHATETTIFEHGNLTSKQALDYQAVLLKLPPMPGVADKVGVFERMMFLDIAQTSGRDGLSVLEALGKDDGVQVPEGGADILTATLNWESVMRLGNTWYNRIETGLQKPTRAERSASAKQIEDELRKMKNEATNLGLLDKFFLNTGEPEKVRAKVSDRLGKILVSLLMPAFHKVSDAADRGEQNQINGIIATALAAHFADEKRYPEKLADLVPKYLANVPDDVFNGKPLIYSKTDNVYLFYSVGVNGTDDGGKLVTDQPRGDDIGVRMPRK